MTSVDGLVGIPRALFLDAAVLAWFLSEAYVATVALRGAGEGGERRRSDRGSFLVVLVGIVVAIVTSNALRAAGVGLLPAWTLPVGLALLGAGIVVRLWAVRSLGRFFSFVVQVRADHRIITEGPYRWLRHPSYTGVILAVLGYAFLVGSWPAIPIVLAVVGAVIGYRIRVEEQALTERFGAEYRSYVARTWRLFPFLV